MGTRAEGEEAGPSLTPEALTPELFERCIREVRAELLAALASAKDATFVQGVEAAAEFVDVCGRERGGYFGQAAATLAELLRVAASRHLKAIEDDGGREGKP